MEYEIIKTTTGYYRGGVNSTTNLLKGSRIRNITQHELDTFNEKYSPIRQELPLYIRCGENITSVSIFAIEMKKNREPNFTKQC